MTQLENLARQIANEHRSAIGAARNALGHARKAGELLLAAKGQTPHGQWLPWLLASFEFTPRTAQSYMRVAEHWQTIEANTIPTSHLTIKDALALLAPPKEYEIHEIGLIVPAMTEDEFSALCVSIDRMGLLQKITLFEGKVLDGKERLRACIAVGADPEFETLEERQPEAHSYDDAIAFVVSMNLMRQSFDPDTRRELEARLAA